MGQLYAHLHLHKLDYFILYCALYAVEFSVIFGRNVSLIISFYLNLFWILFLFLLFISNLLLFLFCFFCFVLILIFDFIFRYYNFLLHFFYLFTFVFIVMQNTMEGFRILDTCLGKITEGARTTTTTTTITPTHVCSAIPTQLAWPP